MTAPAPSPMIPKLSVTATVKLEATDRAGQRADAVLQLTDLPIVEDFRK